MKKSYVEVTTYDTGKTYRFPAKESVKNPQLWEVDLSIATVNPQGHSPQPRAERWRAQQPIYLERNSLVKAGLLPKRDTDKPEKGTVQARTPEDLIYELLEMLGFYPEP